MKKIFVLLSLFFAVGVGNAAVTTVQSKTVNATVYLSGAELQETATISLLKGENMVRIEGLASKIERNSLQLSLGGGAVITKFDFKVDYMGKIAQGNRCAALQDSLQKYKRKEAELTSLQLTNTQLQELLEAGVTHSLQAGTQSLSSEAIEKQLLYFQQRHQQLLAKANSIDEQLSAVQARIGQIEKQIQEEGQGTKRSGVVEMTVQSPAAYSAKAQIKYFTPSARWIPYYDLNLPEGKTQAKLTLKARVIQTTGIDWKQVKLSLSTYTPSSNNKVPEFNRWVLRDVQPVVYNERQTKARRAEPMMMAMADATAEEDYDEMPQYVTQQEQALSQVYAISLPYTVEGNGKEQSVVLTEQTINNIVYKYQSVPKLDKDVYLSALINSWENASLLAGSVNITYGNTYMGQTNIDPATTDKEMKITLGKDKQIVVARKLQAETTRTKTVGSNKVVEQTYAITVRNNKKEAVELVLKEQYPVSSAKEIQVSLNETTTAFAENDKENGVLTYNVSLQPAEVKTIVVSYTVKYPKEWRVNL